jgi:hypothetical protein
LTATIDERRMSAQLDAIFVNAMDEAMAEVKRQVVAEGGQDVVPAERQREILNRAINWHMVQATAEGIQVVGKEAASHPVMVAFMQKVADAFPVNNSDALSPSNAATTGARIATVAAEAKTAPRPATGKAQGKNDVIDRNKQPMRANLITASRRVAARMPKPQQQTPDALALAHANRRLTQLIIGGTLAMVVYGLLLPMDWQAWLGILAQPIVWAAETAPSIAKITSLSVFPELIKGFFGVGCYVVPLYGLFMYIYCGFPRVSLRYVLSLPGRPFWEKVVLLYLLFVPMLIFFLWIYYFYTPSGDLSGMTVTRGGIIFLFMLKSRLALAFFGSLLTVGMSMSVCYMINLFVGPIILMINGGKQWRQ